MPEVLPEVSRFYGIIIKIFYDDHHPPHFHAEYGDHEVLISINTLAVLRGGLPARALGLADWSRSGPHSIKKICALPGTARASFGHLARSRPCHEQS